jgi:nitroreductase
MDIREALYTTRAMRRVKPDPIPMDVQARIMDAAVRAPSGGTTQNWRFLLVDDPEVKAKLGPIYRQAMSVLWGSYYKDRLDAAHDAPELEESKSMLRVQKSAQWLADNFEMVPLYMFGFAQHDPSGSSVYPALWNAQLAARAEGVGTSLTQVLVFHNDEVLDILGVPKDEGWNMLGCVSLGYPTGKWGVATRQPAHDVSFRNQWGDDVGFRDDEPLWP